MSLTQGVDFRQTLAFVTDPANCFFMAPNAFNATYPTVSSPSGVNVGWETAGMGDSSRDDSAYTGAAASLAGCHFTANAPSGQATFRVDLPASGSYTINAAFGRPAGGMSGGTVVINDTNTTLATPCSSVTTAADEFYDASGVKRTSHTDWVSNNASITETFSTTILRVVGTNADIATLFIQSAASGFTAKFRRTLSQVGTRVGSRQAQAA